MQFEVERVISKFPEVQVVCAAMKRYGMLLADNGSSWYVSGAPDPRWSDENLADLRRIPGSAFRTTMNTRSYLTFGVPRPPAVLVEGSSAFLPVSHKVDNILTIESKDPLISGVAWQESIDRLKGSVYVVAEPHGRGQVITFADDPHFRLFWRATLPVFLNAVIYSPSFPR